MLVLKLFDIFVQHYLMDISKYREMSSRHKVAVEWHTSRKDRLLKHFSVDHVVESTSDHSPRVLNPIACRGKEYQGTQ